MSKPVRWTTSLLAAAAVVVIAACAPAASRTSVRASATCDGPMMLVLRNNSGGDVHIVESRPGGRTSTLGVYGPGLHEMRVTNEPRVTYLAYAANRAPGGDSRLLTATSRRSFRNLAVTLERKCDTN